MGSVGFNRLPVDCRLQGQLFHKDYKYPGIHYVQIWELFRNQWELINEQTLNSGCQHRQRLKCRSITGTHHAVSNCVAVGSELRVDVGEEPAERSTPESWPQGLPLRNVPDVYSWVLGKEVNTHRSKFYMLSILLPLNDLEQHDKCKKSFNFLTFDVAINKKTCAEFRPLSPLSTTTSLEWQWKSRK